MTPPGEQDHHAKARQALDRWLAMVYRMVRAQMSREARIRARREELRRKGRDGDH